MNRAKPVVMVHGLDAFGSSSDCAGTFQALADDFKDLGWTDFDTRPSGVTLGYYQGDTNCYASVNGSGSHTANTVYNDSHPASEGHNNDTAIEHLAYHFAWYVYNTFSSNGIWVDAIGHSMGGLIIRWAVMATQLANQFSPGD